jgi:hypothetical protein
MRERHEDIEARARPYPEIAQDRLSDFVLLRLRTISAAYCPRIAKLQHEDARTFPCRRFYAQSEGLSDRCRFGIGIPVYIALGSLFVIFPAVVPASTVGTGRTLVTYRNLTDDNQWVCEGT